MGMTNMQQQMNIQEFVIGDVDEEEEDKENVQGKSGGGGKQMVGKECKD